MSKKIVSVLLCFLVLCVPVSVNAEDKASNPDTSSNEMKMEKIKAPSSEDSEKDNAENNKEDVKESSKKDKDDKNLKDSKKSKDEEKKSKEKKTKDKEKSKKSESKKPKESEIKAENLGEDIKYNKSSNISAYKYDSKFFDPAEGTVLRYPLSREATLTTRFRQIDSYHSYEHQGIDLAISEGTPVLASNSGEIVRASWYGGYGNCVDIEHNDGSLTRYAHMSEINVKVGDNVLRGQLIGKVGNTGRSFGAHLHFEYYPPHSSNPSNPIDLLNQRVKVENKDYINVKLTFIKNTKSVSLKTLNTDDIYFQMNEPILPKESKNKIIVDLSRFVENGLISSIDKNNVYILDKCKFTIKDNKIIINKKIKSNKIQILIPSNEFSKKSIPIFIQNNLNNEKEENHIHEFSPLSNMEIKLDVNGISKENLNVKINDKNIDYELFDYIDNKIILYYSCLNINNIKIIINKEKHEIKEVNKSNNINNIMSWIESDNIDIMRFNSFIDNCYFMSSNIDDKLDDKPYAYNRYNNEEYGVTVDDKTADGYISIPVELTFQNMNLKSKTDKITNDEIKIKNSKYNVFIYGEKLNILDKTEIKDGVKEVNFRIIDTFEDNEYSYFIISYEVEGIGGYFGIKIKK